MFKSVTFRIAVLGVLSSTLSVAGGILEANAAGLKGKKVCCKRTFRTHTGPKTSYLWTDNCTHWYDRKAEESKCPKPR